MSKTSYSYSVDEENYHGPFDTEEQASDEAAACVGVGGNFWVGGNAEPTAPESLWNAEDWIESVQCQDEYCGELADGWPDTTRKQDEELETEVRRAMGAWLDRHNLRPKFWTVINPRKFHVAGEVGNVFEIEALS